MAVVLAARAWRTHLTHSAAVSHLRGGRGYRSGVSFGRERGWTRRKPGSSGGAEGGRLSLPQHRGPLGQGGTRSASGSTKRRVISAGEHPLTPHQRSRRPPHLWLPAPDPPRPSSSTPCSCLQALRASPPMEPGPAAAERLCCDERWRGVK